MKKHILFILLLTCIYSYSQVSVGPKHYGKPGKFKSGTLKNFKNSTTIFVFSNVFDKEVYEDILKNSWTVTQYKIVSHEDFNPLDYDKGNYSFATLQGFKRVKTTKMGSIVVSLYTHFDILMYDFESINKKLEKLSPKKIKKKFNSVLSENKISIARFHLYPSGDFVSTALRKNMSEIYTSMFTDDVFYNYKPGSLKNYFQKLNELIKNEEIYWMYEENDYTKEIIKLPKNTLFILSYLSKKVDAWTATDLERKDKEVIELYDNYEFTYKFISDDDLDERILNGEEFYYLRYVRVNAQKFLEVVNSKSGDIIYRNYVTGLAYNIKPKHLKELNKTIKKAIKKSL